MMRLATFAMLAVLATGSLVWGAATVVPPIEDVRNKAAISDADRQLVRQWINQYIDQMLTNTEPDRRGMVSARETIVAEGREQTGHSPAYVQAYGEEAIAALKEAERRAVGPDARLNVFMTVADLRRPEGVPLLATALLKDPFAATRYWGAKGMDQVADVVVSRSLTNVQTDMVAAAEKAFAADMPAIQALPLLSMLGKFEVEKAHDVLADAVISFVQHNSAQDPVAAQVMDQVLSGLEKAYSREVRPESKARLLMAYATMCVWVMPPAAANNLMPDLNSTLERITGDRVGFLPSDDPVIQKLSLLEWVERFVRDKKIPKRPALPPSIDQAAKDALEGGAAPAPEAPIPAPATPAQAAPAAGSAAAPAIK